MSHPTTPEVIERRDVSLMRLDPQALIAKAIESGSGIDTMERLVALAKDVREVQAREAWYEAMAVFQARCPAIKKTATANIHTVKASYSYRFAPLDEITSVIQPVMGPLGLSVSWRSRIEPAQVVVSCRVSHTLGHHEESGDIAMPVMKGDGTGANDAQRVGIALTYAKRYSLLGIIGLAPEDDKDAEPRTGKPPEAEQSTGGGSTLVAAVEEKSGTAKNGKPWTRYLVMFEDGRSGSTFDARLAQQARLLADAKAPTIPTLVQSGEYTNLEALVDPAAPSADDPGAASIIDEKQVKRFSAIAAGMKWTADQVHDLLTGYKYNSTKEIRVTDYETIADALKLGYAAWRNKLAAKPEAWQGTLA